MGGETGEPASPALRWLRDLFTKLYVRPLGGAVSGDRAGFSYLASSIRSFYGEAELERIFASAGLEKLEVKRLMMGMVAVHVYNRPQRTGIAANTEGGP